VDVKRGHILWEERQGNIFQNMVLRRVPELREKGEVTGGQRKFHNEKFYNLYPSPHIIRTMKSGREWFCMYTRNILVWKS
jgi:hypothetical protein